MNKKELFINNVSVDLTDDIKVQIDKYVADFRDINKKTGVFTMPFVLPYTNKNSSVFFGENDKQVLGKFRRTYPAQLMVNNEVVIDGKFLHTKNSNKGFEGAVGEAKIGNPKIGDLLKDLKLTDIQSFTPINFSGNQSVQASWNAVNSYPDAEVCHPYVLTSFSQFHSGVTTLKSHYEDLGISHFVPAIMKRIFQDAGYTLGGDIFNNDTFKKMVMLYSSTEKQKWNYGKLVPFFGTGQINFISYVGSPGKMLTRQNDYIYIMLYQHIVSAPVLGTVGDACQGLDSKGYYTCKYSGVYTFTVEAEHSVNHVGGAAVASTGWTALRCITDEEYIPESFLPLTFSNTPPTLASLDPATLAVGQGTFSFSVRLEEGKQYALQRYVSVLKTATTTGGTVDPNTMFVYNPILGQFSITACDGPLLVNPAHFLPDLTQKEFVNSIFKIFNLYYELNQDTQTVTLLTRDDFFQESLSDIVDITPYLNLQSLEELPLSDKEVGQTYLTWDTDDSDYILKQTDYMELVNGLQPDESTKLPFAPLGFMKVKYQTGSILSPTVVYDILPAIITATDSVDTSVLVDADSVTSGGSWKPRICLYHGNQWLRNDFNEVLSPYISNVYLSGVAGVHYPPKLTFFNINNQPAYTITENIPLRSFELVLNNTITIYNPVDTNILISAGSVAELDNISLATNISSTVNPKGLFFQLYSNDLLIGSLSHYMEGIGRMNPVLFSQLTGRQTLSLNNDLFLLDSIKGYDVGADLATYKIYKLVANQGTPILNNIRYNSTRSYTATCPSGTTGSSVTKTATSTSFISQAIADNIALAQATTLANRALVCF